MLEQTATFISAPHSEALRNACRAPPSTPRINRTPMAAAFSGNRSWHQLTSRAPVRRAPNQADRSAGRSWRGSRRQAGHGSRNALAAKVALSRMRPAARTVRTRCAADDAPRRQLARPVQHGAGVEVRMAAGEHGDRDAAVVELIDQIGEQLAGGAGVRIEKAVHDQEPLALGRRRAPVPPRGDSLPRTIILRVRQTMRRSIQGPALRTYQVSSASFSSTLNLAAVHLGPAGDAGAHRDALGNPVGWSRASSGRGPMKDMSPRTTLKSWGSSSRRMRRSARPTADVRSASGSGTPWPSHGPRMVRNL